MNDDETMAAARPVPEAEELQRLVRRQLAPHARLAHVALLLAAAAVTVALLALGMGEPGLPVRTRTALLALGAIGLGWTGYAGWVLRTRQVLLGRHRVIAAAIGLAASAAFTASALAASVLAGSPAAVAASVAGLLLSALAALQLHRARRAVAALRARRDALERALVARR
ncbi:hypothetical protein [Coralloluteibacterium stylophorae]|uniref:Transmembrane transport protein n=1 Tax=Coralloluteibacterium stylophorae TaxID=1776034 RepID=A0A8J7VSS5_9GAMM|nr:hypothetical protein [Coralloluteibacterium stylophorae]MBS7458249.1 hypothetical protein [Coralloluteibacterium stylophorae]